MALQQEEVVLLVRAARMSGYEHGHVHDKPHLHGHNDNGHDDNVHCDNGHDDNGHNPHAHHHHHHLDDHNLRALQLRCRPGRRAEALEAGQAGLVLPALPPGLSQARSAL